MAETILWFDPGLSSGVALGTYSDTEPFTLVKAWQVSGGLVGLGEWLDDRFLDEDYDFDFEASFFPAGISGLSYEEPIKTDDIFVGCEKFTPLQNKGFNLTLDSVEPLRCEGMLVDRGLVPDYSPDSPHWQRPNEMYWLPGSSTAKKRQAAHKWLKEHDLYVTGKMVGQKDADDARSAILHCLAYLRRFHPPTQEHYFGRNK